jgi:hypothetical protein
VFAALGGAARAAQLIDGGTIAKNSLPGNRVKNGTLSAAALKPTP